VTAVSPGGTLSESRFGTRLSQNGNCIVRKKHPVGAVASQVGSGLSFPGRRPEILRRRLRFKPKLGSLSRMRGVGTSRNGALEELKPVFRLAAKASPAIWLQLCQPGKAPTTRGGPESEVSLFPPHAFRRALAKLSLSFAPVPRSSFTCLCLLLPLPNARADMHVVYRACMAHDFLVHS
jgi:hypothetical protein